MSADESPRPGSEPGGETPSGDADRPLIIRSEDLLQGRREIWIEHGGEMYRLRVTAAGRLYLTK